MPLWQWALDSAAVLVLLVLLYGLALVVRRRLLARHGGAFELSYRVRTSGNGRGWVLGLGRYSGEQLEWFRVFSLSPRPRCAWSRRELRYDGRRDPEPAEQMALYADHVIVTLGLRDTSLELALSASSLVGLQSWLEAGPPGADWDRNRRR